MEEILKRETAKIILIKNLLSSKYFKEENKPNYFDGPSGKFSRINILGILIFKESQKLILDDSSGSIEIRSFNDINSTDFEIGDTLNIVGKPREFNGSIYIIPEIIKKITNQDFIAYRKLELSASELSKNNSSENISFNCTNTSENKPLKDNGEKNLNMDEEQISEIIDSSPNVHSDRGTIRVPVSVIEKNIILSEAKDEVKELQDKPENLYSKIINKIQELDSGDGVFIETIVSSLNISDCENKILRLLEKGDIFEIRPGKIKVL